MKVQPEEFFNSETLEDYQTDGLLICDKKGIRATAERIALLKSDCASGLLEVIFNEFDGKKMTRKTNSNGPERT